MRATKCVLTLAASVLIATNSFGQMVPGRGAPHSSAGIFWQYNVNQQRVEFSSLPGVPGCCQEYEDAIGTGFTAGAFIDVRLDRDWTITMRVSYGTHDATVTDTENLTIPDNGQPIPAVIEHAIDAELSSVDFDAILGLRLFAGMYANLGFRVGVYIGADYYQNETLVQPYRIGTFENGRRVRNEFEGEIPRLKNVLGSIIMGLAYDLPMNERNTVFLTPQLQYFLNVTPVVKDLEWYADGIHIGLALKFGLGGGAPMPQDGPGRDEYEGWKERQQRPLPHPSSLRNHDDPRVPQGDLRENPPPGSEEPVTEPYGRHYEDDVDEEGNPVVAPPEQSTVPPENAVTPPENAVTPPEHVETPPENAVTQPKNAVTPPENAETPPKKAMGDLRRQDLEPVPTDANITPSPRTRTIEKIQTAAAESAESLDELAVKAFAMERSGGEAEFTSIKAEEFGVTDVVTLLNYVFFPESSSEIPSRYAMLKPDKAEGFRIGNLDAGDKMRLHYNVLNIIGSRLQEYPEANITIVGCNSGAGPEQGRLDLSRARAEAVRDYFTDIWGVNSQRMTLVSRALPETPTLGEDDADEENRRVEIYSDTWEILRPIVWSKTEWRSVPPAVRFEIPAIDEDDMTNWRFSVTQDSDVLKEYSGGNKMPESLDWDLMREQPFRSGLEVPVEYVLHVTDANGDAYKSQGGRIPLSLTSTQEKRIAGLPDKEFTRYHLIIFEKDEEDGTPYQQKVTEMVASIFGSEAVVTVLDSDGGVSDEETYADSPLRIGTNDMPLNTALPEGRFYSRAIRVLVEAPVER